MSQLLSLLWLFFATFGVGTATEVGSTEYGPSSDESGWTNYVPLEPTLVLASRAGSQTGVLVRYEIETGDGGHGGEMTPATPEKVTVARPGESVSISITGVEPTERLVVVRALGCKDRVLASTSLDAHTPGWRVPTRPGAYEIEVSVPHFEPVGGGTGTATALFGLLVDERRAPAVVRASRDLFACAPSE